MPLLIVESTMMTITTTIPIAIAGTTCASTTSRRRAVKETQEKVAKPRHEDE